VRKSHGTGLGTPGNGSGWPDGALAAEIIDVVENLAPITISSQQCRAGRGKKKHAEACVVLRGCYNSRKQSIRQMMTGTTTGESSDNEVKQ